MARFYGSRCIDNSAGLTIASVSLLQQQQQLQIQWYYAMAWKLLGGGFFNRRDTLPDV